MPAHKARNFKSVESCRTVERADDPSVKYVTLGFIHSQVASSPTKIVMDCWYSRTFTKGHLSATATFFGGHTLTYIDSCLNLSTTATSFCPHRDRC